MTLHQCRLCVVRMPRRLVLRHYALAHIRRRFRKPRCLPPSPARCVRCVRCGGLMQRVTVGVGPVWVGGVVVECTRDGWRCMVSRFQLIET